MKMFRTILALSLLSVTLAAPSQTVSTPAPAALPVCGANELLIAVGGGCFVGADGVQQCAPPKAPTCQCASGYQRNAATRKCDKSEATSVRAGRSVSDAVKNCSGPNEHLVAVGGGCYIDATGKQVCAPPKPPSCVCVSGFERNSTTKVCEAASSVQKTKLI